MHLIYLRFFFESERGIFPQTEFVFDLVKVINFYILESVVFQLQVFLDLGATCRFCANQQWWRSWWIRTGSSCSGYLTLKAIK